MKVSAATELAIRGLTELAMRFGQGPITLDTICAGRDLPKQYLTKIFASLTRAGLIRPVRGKKGGYMLARDPEQVNLLEVIEAVQGPLCVNLCTHEPPQCDQDDCPLRPVWRELQEQIRDKLASVTLADAATPLAKAPQS